MGKQAKKKKIYRDNSLVIIINTTITFTEKLKQAFLLTMIQLNIKVWLSTSKKFVSFASKKAL